MYRGRVGKHCLPPIAFFLPVWQPLSLLGFYWCSSHLSVMALATTAFFLLAVPFYICWFITTNSTPLTITWKNTCVYLMWWYCTQWIHFFTIWNICWLWEKFYAPSLLSILIFKHYFKLRKKSQLHCLALIGWSQ